MPFRPSFIAFTEESFLFLVLRITLFLFSLNEPEELQFAINSRFLPQAVSKIEIQSFRFKFQLLAKNNDKNSDEKNKFSAVRVRISFRLFLVKFIVVFLGKLMDPPLCQIEIKVGTFGLVIEIRKLLVARWFRRLYLRSLVPLVERRYRNHSCSTVQSTSPSYLVIFSVSSVSSVFCVPWSNLMR